LKTDIWGKAYKIATKKLVGNSYRKLTKHQLETQKQKRPQELKSLPRLPSPGRYEHLSLEFPKIWKTKMILKEMLPINLYA